jgi:Uma2 family endonuclease
MQALNTKIEVSFSSLLHCYTLEELWALPEPDDRSHYELIGGFLFMVPPPDPPHDDIDARLNKSLVQYLLTRYLEGDILHPRASIYKDVAAGTYLEPDMMYVSQELKQRMGRKRSSADIVFEYVSRSNAVYDRTTKADTYLALGVRELWLIDPFTVTIEVRYAVTRKGQPAWEIWSHSRGDTAASRVLQGWSVSVDELFAGLTQD